MKGYPAWFTANLVHLNMLVLFASGCLLIPTTLDMRLLWDVSWKLSADLRILTTALHVLFGFVVCLLVGAMWSIHMRYWWRKKLQRVSGLVVVILLIVLGLSSVAILYFGNEVALTYASVIHGLVGLVFVVPYLWHSVFQTKKSA